MQYATFGAGCFWGVELIFRRTPGVLNTAVGYSGGKVEHPSYQNVCSGKTGHAEVVHLTFDPDQITYQKLLDVFWENHNPTTLNRQGPDTGPQYRSVIFYHSQTQEREAKTSMAHRQTQFKLPIVTQIVPACTFYRAEEYHQQYLEKRGISHCHL